jgi:hypothetical protein
MSASNEVEDIILNYLLRDTAPPSLGSVYVRLFLADPGEEASYVNEVSGGGYTGQLVTFSDPALSGSSSNTNVIDSAIATTDWGTITHFAIVSEQTGTSGKMVARAAFAVPIEILTGQKFQAAIGDLVVSHT